MARPTFTTVYKTVGNCEISTDVYIPSNTAKTHAPVLINIHGGGFMLGASSIVNKDQIADCLARGWIVVVPNHRLCPQVSILAGPIQDIRDLLSWIHAGHLDRALAPHTSLRADLPTILAFGTSAGAHLSLCLGFDTPHPPKAILDFYAPCAFTHEFWKQELPMAAKLPAFPSPFLAQIYAQDPIPTTAGTSLEGQTPAKPDFSDPRVAFALTHLANGKFLDVCFPPGSGHLRAIDPVMSITSTFPPTCIVHGQADTMVPMYLSKVLFEELKRRGVESEFIEVEGEEHTFAGKMVKGSRTWEVQRRGFDWLEKFVV